MNRSSKTNLAANNTVADHVPLDGASPLYLRDMTEAHP